MRLQINPEEAKRLIEEAQAGNWLPLAIVIFLVSVIITLFIFILKIYKAQNEKRHEDTEATLKELVNNNRALTDSVLIHEHKLNEIHNKISA